MNVEPIALEGEFVKLEPLLAERHFEDLRAVALDADLWRWTTNFIETAEDLRKYLQIALDEQASGVSLPFATVDKASGKAIGSTRFGNIDRKNKRVEIGWTWLGKQFQRTALNTEAKFLMLQHAFEVWNCNRVELKTDTLNARSRAAISRLGAVEEGVLRQHLITDGGRVRDTVYFSVVRGEWETVKSNLNEKLNQQR